MAKDIYVQSAPKSALVGKTILLLGGSDFQVPAIQAAKDLGLRTVLCDYLPDNPGQYVADVFYQKSTTDREAMLEVARAERVDGVLSFCSDVALPSAAYVAEQLGLPTNPLPSVEILSNKQLFHPYLSRHGFACPHLVSFAKDASVDEVMHLAADLSLPIVIKPTDSSGSKGVTRLDELSFDAVAQALDAASSFSRNDVLVAEEFIEYEYPHLIGGDIFVKDGKIYKLEGSIQSEQAAKSGLSFQGKPIEWHLTDDWGYPLEEDRLYKPYYGERCRNCGMKLTCNGCSRCGKCALASVVQQ